LPVPQKREGKRGGKNVLKKETGIKYKQIKPNPNPKQNPKKEQPKQPLLDLE
jgi:hypothetical protein